MLSPLRPAVEQSPHNSRGLISAVSSRANKSPGDGEEPAWRWRDKIKGCGSLRVSRDRSEGTPLPPRRLPARVVHYDVYRCSMPRRILCRDAQPFDKGFPTTSTLSRSREHLGFGGGTRVERLSNACRVSRGSSLSIVRYDSVHRILASFCSSIPRSVINTAN